MEGIDLAGVVDSDFQGIQINFAPPRRICQFSRGGAHIPGGKKKKMETNEHVKIVLLWTLWEWVSQWEDKNASVKRTQGSTD